MYNNIEEYRETIIIILALILVAFLASMDPGAQGRLLLVFYDIAKYQVCQDPIANWPPNTVQSKFISIPSTAILLSYL